MSIIAIIIVTIAVLTILWILFMRKMVQRYEVIMLNASSIYEGLKEWRNTFPFYAIFLREFVDMALNYLDYSLYRDYKTAFTGLEKYVKLKRFREVNQHLLDVENKKIQYLLPR